MPDANVQPSQQNSEVARPQASRRDPGELKQRLERWMARRMSAGAEPRITALDIPASNGMSSETVLFDATWRDGGNPRTAALVARVAPDAATVPVFPTYDMDCQFRVIGLVGAQSPVPVPRGYWSEPDPAAVGAPFFVMERIEGRVPPDVMPYNFGSWLSEASAVEQRQLQDDSVRVLADLHAIDKPTQRFAFLDLPGPGPTPLRRHVADQWRFYQWAGAGLRLPLIERCFAWLEDHWPTDEGDTVLCWGDARPGNIIYREFTPAAVLDWEMATLGPREMDVAWMIYLHRFFEDIAANMGLPGMPHFMRRDDVAATYESLTGHTPRDLDFYTMYAALRQGIIMSRIQHRAIRFGEAMMPTDVDDLIMHRATLEAMLAGTYWRDRG